MKRILSILLITSVLIFILISCSEDKDSPIAPKDDSGLIMEERNGFLILPDGSTINYDELEVVTFGGSSDIDHEGYFSVNAPTASTYQVITFLSKNDGRPVFLGLYDPLDDTVVASLESTALALMLFNPMLIYSDQALRIEYLDAVQQNYRFELLLDNLREHYQTNAEMALDNNANPVAYQLVVQITKDTMELLDHQERSTYRNQEPPTINNANGNYIEFENPRHVWYAAGIRPGGGNTSDVVTVNRQKTLYSFDWGWPPVSYTEPARTNYLLGNGYFEIFITRGFDFSKINQWNDPAGRATLLNTAQSIIYFIELIIGSLPESNLQNIHNYINISPGRAADLSLNMSQGAPQDFLINFCRLIDDNADEISLWIWQDLLPNAATNYLRVSSRLTRNVALAFRLFGYSDEQSAFFLDLIHAPNEITYFITQENGMIVSTDLNEPPKPSFSISPPAGIVGTEFVFDASTTSDDHDDLENLYYRWDWESDGIWDTGWIAGNPIATHSYNEPGAYQVTLEVRDSGQLTSSVSRNLNVGGGAGTATRVKLFRDVLPWNTNAMVDMLEALGFEEQVEDGDDEYTYQIIPSTEFGTVPLIPGDDLIIISNDQNQGFYNNYADSQLRFTNFVNNGGSLFWQACDQGWAGGSISEAGIVLPGNITAKLNLDRWNYVVDHNLPLVAALPDSMQHNYASHESFVDLPDGVTVYTVDSDGDATLIEFNIGAGWIVFTGQPLEHQYVYSSGGMEKLLSRIVSHFTGKEMPDEDLIQRKPLTPLRDSR